MNKTAISIVIVILSLFNASSLFADQDITLQLRWDHQFQFAGYYAAEMQGYYRDAGLNVKIHGAIDEKQHILSAVDEVAAGRADFGIGAADILIANEQHKKLRVVASIFQRSAARLYVNKHLWPVEISTLARDYRIARRVNDLIDVEFQTMLKNEGIDPASVKPYEHQTGIEHIIEGEVDVIPGYLLTVPFYARQADLELAEINPSHFGVDFYGDSIFTTREIISSDPEMVEKFVVASKRGWLYAIQHPQQIIAYLIKNYPRNSNLDNPNELNLFQFERINSLLDSEHVEIGLISTHKWKRMHSMLKEGGLINYEFNAKDIIWVPQTENAKAKKKKLEDTILTVVFLLLLSFLTLVYLYVNLLRQKKIVTKREEEYRALYEEAAHGSLVVDTNTGLILSCNKKLSEMLDTSAKELIGLGVKSIFTGLEIESFYRKKISDEVRNCIDFCPTHKITAKNGKAFFVEVHSNRIVVDHKDLILISVYDISLRTKHELLQNAQLRLIEFAQKNTSKELLRKFLDEAELLTSSEIGFYHFVLEDQETLSLQQWSSRTVENECKMAQEHEHYPISEAGIWMDCVRERKPVIHNDYAATPHKKGLPEGHTPVVREMVVPVFREGKIVAVLGVGNKPTEYNEDDLFLIQRLADFSWETIIRKQWQEKLLENKVALEKSQEIGHIGTWEIDLAKNTLAWTKETYRIFGIAEDETIGYQTILERVHPEDRKFVDRQWHQALENGIYDIEHRIVIHDEVKWIRAKADFTFNQQGVAVKAIGVVQDITTSKKLMDDYKRSAQLAALGTVAAGVAHEINNPIQGVMSYASLLTMLPKNDQDINDVAGKIIAESTRIANITRDMLYYSKTNVIEMAEINIEQIVEAALSLIRGKLSKERVFVKTNFAENLPLIKVHPQAIQQIVFNLVDNAFDAIQSKETLSEDQKIVTVSTRLIERDLMTYICLEFHDNGIGMSEEVTRKAKEAFYSTKPATKGTGLGMAIVSDIVNKHMGHFDIESVEGEYTKIQILLPVRQDAKSVV